jgi:predicted alpha/beta-fold hydrolase
MIRDAAEFRPTPLLRNRHVQSVLASSRLRWLSARRVAARLKGDAEEVVLDCGNGVRLQGFHTRQNVHAESRGLVVMLHGWEGSVESSYLLHTGARLLADGFDVFRLHFRDHGATHHLNEDLFHSCLIDEVVGAVHALSQRFSTRPLHVVGYSLGGNFALRVALRAPAAGIPLAHAVAVCPVISPVSGLSAIEAAPWFYERYFLIKWGGSLKRKQQLYPQRFAFSRRDLRANLRGLTRLLVERHTDFGSIDDYLDGYSLAGDRLAALQVPVSILTSVDDPIIPVADFRALALPPIARLDIAPFGGHCGFIQDFSLRGYAEDYVVARIDESARASMPGAVVSPAATMAV